MNDFSHLDPSGASRMVDVSTKDVTARTAKAEGKIVMTAETLAAVRDRRTTSKGDVLEVARVAGITGAKRTGDLIPLCHPLALDAVTIDFEFADEKTIRIVAEAKVTARTGVEMEALVAVTTAALTIYDMCKSMDRSISIESVHLLEKSGGRSGHYARSESET